MDVGRLINCNNKHKRGTFFSLMSIQSDGLSQKQFINVLGDKISCRTSSLAMSGLHLIGPRHATRSNVGSEMRYNVIR